MAYLRPPLFQRRVFNPLAMRFGISGARPLEVAGATRVPVIPVDYDGARYIVSARGESHWVRKLRGMGRGELAGEPFTATEIPLEQRDPIIGAYRQTAGRSVAGYWKKLPDAKDHPVFRVEPAG